MNNNTLDVYRYMELYSYIQTDNQDILTSDKQIHLKALYDARVKVEGKIVYNEKKKILK